MKPCHVLSMFLPVWHLKPYVFIWFVLIKKRVVGMVVGARGELCKILLVY